MEVGVRRKYPTFVLRILLEILNLDIRYLSRRVEFYTVRYSAGGAGERAGGGGRPPD